MTRNTLSAILLALAAAPLRAQQPAGAGEPQRVGPGVTPPKLVRKIEPEYSGEARTALIQGTVILQVVVTAQGRADEITVLSPLGFGLDEQAIRAVEKWEFAPGIKAGRPVPILAIIEVNFRFPGVRFDEKAEHQRTMFNQAVAIGKKPKPTDAEIERAVKTVLELSKQKFTPAMFLAGIWMIAGEHVPKDEVEGFSLVRKAAERHHGPAIYEVAVRRIEGRDMERDVEKGLQEMRDAATLGSRMAQYYLGNRYEKGDGVPKDLERAKRYFRLCSSEGVALCQYRLGRLLFDAEGRRERDYVQAIALFQLAGEQGVKEARQIAEEESAKLTPEQNAWLAGLKRQIVRK